MECFHLCLEVVKGCDKFKLCFHDLEYDVSPLLQVVCPSSEGTGSQLAAAFEPRAVLDCTGSTGGPELLLPAYETD